MASTPQRTIRETVERWNALHLAAQILSERGEIERVSRQNAIDFAFNMLFAHVGLNVSEANTQAFSAERIRWLAQQQGNPQPDRFKRLREDRDIMRLSAKHEQHCPHCASNDIWFEAGKEAEGEGPWLWCGGCYRYLG